MNEDKATEVAIEVLPPSTLEALERAHIDVQVATAHKYPRSIEKFKKRALEMATLDYETAESCIYSRPVGKEKDPKSGEWVTKYAEGASIRLAEIVGACYGNLRVASRIVEQTERYVTVEGVAHDLETNFAAKSEVKEMTVKKDGTPYDERMRAVIAKAALSKGRRDATFTVVPRALCKSVIDAAKAIVIGDSTTLEDRRKKAAEWVKSKNIEEARVFSAIGVKGWSEVGLEHLNTLTGLKTSIKEGEVTIDDAFPMVAKAPENLEGGPALFTPGAGDQAPKTTSKKKNVTPPQPITDLRAKLADAKLTEADLLAFLRDKGMADESLSNLEEIHKVNAAVITTCLSKFDEIRADIAAMKNKTA
jgi:hypothetical protein